MLSNIPFIGIMIVTILVQLLMVEFGGRMVKCWPMNQMQNIICIVIGAGELIWGFLVKVVPTKFFMNLSLEDKVKEDGSKKSLP
jgi:Ca2+ transporting ATPase